MQPLLICKNFCRWQYRENDWQQNRDDKHVHRHVNGREPAPQPGLAEEKIPELPPPRQIERINGRKVIGLGVQNHHQGQIQRIGHAQEAERRSRPAEEQPQNASHPQRRHQRTEDEHLVQHKREGAHTNVLAVNLIVVQQLERRPVVVHLPKQIRQNQHDQERKADREPFRSE